MAHQSSAVYQLASGPRLLRTIRRIAMQILEDAHGSDQFVLAGLNFRGLHLANRLAESLEKASGRKPEVVQLIPDDESTREKLAANTSILNARHLILVDDVLFSGSTMMSALNLVQNSSKPEVIRIAVLVDRGHRHFPVQPDFYGLRSLTKLNEHVDVVFDDSGFPVSVELSQA